MKAIAGIVAVLVVSILMSGAVGAQVLTPRREVVVKKTVPHSVGFSADGKYMAMSAITGDFNVNPDTSGSGISLNLSNPNRVILLLETSNYKVKRELLKGKEKSLGGFLGSGDPLVFTPNGLLVAVYDESLYVWDPKKGKRIGVWGRELAKVVFSADHRVALAKRNDGKFESFDLGDGHSLGVFDGDPEGKLLALDADRLYMALLREKSLLFRNLKTGEESPLGAIESKELNGAAISRDGRVLAVAAEGGLLSLWDLTTKKKIGERAGDAKSVYSPVFAPDNSVVLYNDGKQLHIWSPGNNTHATFNPKHLFAIGEVMFSDAATLVTLGMMMDPQVKIWNFSAAAAGSAAASAGPGLY